MWGNIIPKITLDLINKDNKSPGILEGPNPPALPPGVDPRLAGMTDWMKTQRQGDISEGQTFADKYFGAGNPQMQAIVDARKAAAFGPDTQTQLAREAGTEGINRSVQTALRQFSGRLPATGVRGGAAGAMAGMLTRDAVGQTRGLERDLSLDAAKRREEALGNYEHTLTGERAGSLGTALGYAGIGSQDRYGGMGYLTGLNFMNSAQKAVDDAKDPLGGGGGKDKPWYQKAWESTPLGKMTSGKWSLSPGGGNSMVSSITPGSGSPSLSDLDPTNWSTSW